MLPQHSTVSVDGKDKKKNSGSGRITPLALFCILFLVTICMVVLYIVLTRNTTENEMHVLQKNVHERVKELQNRLQLNTAELQHLNSNAQELFKTNKQLEQGCKSNNGNNKNNNNNGNELPSSNLFSAADNSNNCPKAGQLDLEDAETQPKKFTNQRRNLNIERPRIFTPRVATLARVDEFNKHEKYRQIFNKRYDLIFAMPTFPRKDEQGKPRDYLRQTVMSLLNEYDKFVREHQDATPLNILIYVQSYHNLDHPVFDDLLVEMNDNPMVILHKSKLRFYDPFDDIPGHNYEAFDNARPGPVARQQNCDVVSLTEHVMRNFDFDYFVFMEDDYLACPSFFKNLYEGLQVVKRKAGPAGSKLCSFRVTYGMSGLIMNRFMVRQLTSYLEENLDALPVDLLARHFQFEDRPHPEIATCKAVNTVSFVYKDVLLEHIGKTSTFKERNVANFRPDFPKCGEPMAHVWSLPQQERFDQSCSADPTKISPCR